MKKLILVLTAFAFVNLSNAQQKNSKKEFNPETKATKEVNKLADSISITPTQKESLHGVFVEFFTTIQQIKGKDEKNKADVLTLKEAKKTRDDKVKSILNDEKKFAKYQSMMAEKKANRKNKVNERKEGKKGAFNPEKRASALAERQVNKISSSISLTQTQQDSLTSIFTERNIARIHFKQNQNKTEEDKTNFRTYMASCEKRIQNSFVSAEQYAQYKDLKKQRMEEFRNKRNPSNNNDEQENGK
ncbi:MAG: hypothetical protein LC109_13035 [Bacteroidia bacterium]|nr:hypothetical protein [Bacteroidia bacterium]